MVAGKPAYAWTGTEWVPIMAPVEGADLGVTDHPALSGRTTPDSHPIEAVTGLELELAGKAPLVHSHPSEDLDAGDGIEFVGVAPTIVNNVDKGSTALNVHVNDADPHPATYAPTVHSHDGEYAPDPHTHAEYDPAGTALAGDQAHVQDQDPHAAYIQPDEIIGGPGIASVVNPDGSVTLTNTAQNVGVSGMGFGQLTERNIPDSTWRAMQLDKEILHTLNGTTGTVVADAGFTLDAGDPEGWYTVFAAVAFIGNANGRRVIRCSVNGDPLLCPLIPQGLQPTALGGSTSFVQTSGPVYLRPGDRIAVEAWQNSGITLTSSIENTVMTILFTGEGGAA